MQHFRALPQQLTQRINSCVCFVLAFSCMGMVTLGFAGAGSYQRRQPSSIEAEDLMGSARASSGQVTRQEMGGFGPGWSGNAQLFWKAPKPVDTPIRNWPHLTLWFKPPAEGNYEIFLHYTSAPDFGTFRVFVNGKAGGDIDGYASSVSPKSRSLGQHKLTAGSHQLIVTVFSKASTSKNFFVGLDRIELRLMASSTVPDLGTSRPDPPRSPGIQPPPPPPGGGQPKGGDKVVPNPPKLTREMCAAKPEICCPYGTEDEGCRLVTEALLEVVIRSYVPPRFTVMGNHAQWDTTTDPLPIVSDREVNGPYKVWPGCRFSVTQATNKIEDGKNYLQKAGELFEAWLAQWSGGIESAKTFISQNVANEVCKEINDTQSCREKVSAAVKLGINLGLASLGIPPEIPDVQQLREHGIRYLAGQAVSYVFSDPEVLKSLPVDEKTRLLIYQQAYDKGVDVLSKELNKVIPPANFNKEKPATWGHLEPAYAPHNAHLYVEVRVKPSQISNYLHLIAVKPNHKWVKLGVYDYNHVYSSIAVDIPTFIPKVTLPILGSVAQRAVILPIELKPHSLASNEADTVTDAKIPGIKISRTWLEQKFGISSKDGVVRAQANYQGWKNVNGRQPSDWDLFYDDTIYTPIPRKKAKFRLVMPFAGASDVVWNDGWEVFVVDVRDVHEGYGVVTRVKGNTGRLHNYLGRIDPAPRCDGKPNLVYGTK